MAITYTELIRRATIWLMAQNSDAVAEMPALVTQAHEQLLNVIDHDLFRTLITGKTLTAVGLGVLDLSAETPRVLEIRGVHIRHRGGTDDWTPLYRRDLELLTALYSRNRPTTPLYYSEYSGPLIIKAFPAPKEDLDLEITANVEPEVLSATNDTNVLGDQAPRAMEKATFRQLAVFMKDWEAAAQYEKEMFSSVTEINTQIQRRRRDETEQRPVETANVMGT